MNIIDVDDAINKAHDKNFEVCAEKFILRKNLLTAIWAAVVLGIGMISGAAAWAMSTQSCISQLLTKSEYHDKQIAELATLQKNIDTKLDQIRNLLIDEGR